MDNPLIKDRFYLHKEGVVCCGACWQDDINKTKAGKYTGDEKVFENDLELMSDDGPIQCDGCLVQNEAYEMIDEAGEDW